MSRSTGVGLLATRRQIDAATEQALLAQCRRQDFESFGKIVDAYQARVVGFVRRLLRNDEEALDVAQEVFIKAFQSMSRFDGRSSLRTWLFRIAYNLCIDRSRRADRSPDFNSLESTFVEDEPLEFADRRWNPEDLALNEELGAVVEQA